MKSLLSLNSMDEIDSLMEGEHFVPTHVGMSEEENKRLQQMRIKYLISKTGKTPKEIVDILQRKT